MDFLAYCGIYCAACSFRVSCLDKDPRHLQPMPAKYDSSKSADVSSIPPCSGCRGDCQCGDCDIKDCFLEKAKAHPEWQSCADCPDLDCNLLRKFAEDGIPHHADAIENLDFIRENGLEAFERQQERIFTCPSCGKRLSWYLTECPDCAGSGQAT